MATNSCFGQIIEEGDKPGFFKVLRKEDPSSETMRAIPHDFIKSISDKGFSNKMVLKLAWGSSWLIKISKTPRFYYMEESGWEQFLRDNALGNNELLTFTHKGNMCFSVNIYQIDCKEILRPKKSATIASSSGRRKREEGKTIYIDVEEEERDSLSELSYPGLAGSTTGRRLKQKQQLNLGKKKVVETGKSKNNNKKKKKKKKKVDDSEAGTSYIVPKFTLTIKKSYLKFLWVPKWFADMHMPEETTKFKMHHPKEKKKSWDVTCVVSDSYQSRFSPGWVRLARDFDLQVGDVCTFELIKPTEMVMYVREMI